MTEWASLGAGCGSPSSIVGTRRNEPRHKSVPPDHILSSLPDTAPLIHGGENGEAASQHTGDFYNLALGEEGPVQEKPVDSRRQARS